MLMPQKPCSAAPRSVPSPVTRHQRLVLALLLVAVAWLAWPASYYTQRLDDPKAVHVPGPAPADDTAALQQALDWVQSTTGREGPSICR